MPIPTIIDEQCTALKTIATLAHLGLARPEAADLAHAAIVVVVAQTQKCVQDIVNTLK